MKDADFVDLGVLPCSLDGGVAARAAIGLVVLGIDQTMELEFRRLMPLDGVGLYASRVFCDNEITPRRCAPSARASRRAPSSSCRDSTSTWWPSAAPRRR
ncbi:hypothetical protein ACFSZS_22720 [Seohaeicola zhoushanensis]